MTPDLRLTNARLVLKDRVVEGALVLKDGCVHAIDEGGAAVKGSDDLAGDYLIPGLVDLHTDALESHIEPRRGVHWDNTAAVIAHDAVTIAAGITTVFDALCIGEVAGRAAEEEALDGMLAGLEHARSLDVLRAEHLVHLRCEVTDPAVAGMLEPRIDRPLVKLISVMDHAPGHRQMKDATYLRDTWMIGVNGMSLEEADRAIDALIERSRAVAPEMRKAVVDLAHERNLAVASHDDETEEHVAMAADLGIDIAEFPTTREAAAEARKRGLSVLMGGPNLVRGGSHSGNVAAGDLARDGVLDALMSDYVMSSMLMGAFTLADGGYDWPLHDAIATVTANPARIAGLDDRGRIAVGCRADLVQVRLADGKPVVRAVWREGRRVF
jgi:alpha-D-ribose 1-methylphosphonate 5-triphosphate diphosphatase